MHHEAFRYISNFKTAEPLTVVEIGSRNINGTVRILFPNAHWTGLDLHEGPMVDVVCDAVEWSPTALVDLVVCCEVLEHAANWRQLLQHSVKWIKPDGRLLLTCAGPGRLPHSHIDGGDLRPGEYYLNLSESDIRQELEMAGVSQIETVKNWFDTYATAVRTARNWFDTWAAPQEV